MDCLGCPDVAQVRAVAATRGSLQYRVGHLEANGIDGPRLLGITWNQLQHMAVTSNIIKKKVLACKRKLTKGRVSSRISRHFAITTSATRTSIEPQPPRDNPASRVPTPQLLKISRRLSHKSIACSLERCSQRWRVTKGVRLCISSCSSTRRWQAEPVGISCAIDRSFTLGERQAIGLW